MPTPAQIRNKINTLLAPFWADVQARQAAYFATHGQYWQGRETHTAEIEHTGSVDAERKGDKLSDVAGSVVGSWKDFKPGINTLVLPCRFRMDVYESEQGHGYTLTARFMHNGRVFERRANVGPLTDRTHDWKEVRD